MRNLINASERELEATALLPIPRQVRPLTEREFNRHIREAGRKQRTLHVKVARAMKGAQTCDTQA